MAARYRHDYAAFRRHVLKAPFMAAEMLKPGERVLARAEITAPFDPDDPDGEHYRDAFSLEIVEDAERVRARISNSDPAALKVEFGTKNNPRHRTLGNALDAAKY